MGLMVTVAADVATGLKTAGLVIVVAGGGALIFSELVGRTTAALLHPGGSSRRRGEYSAPQALVAKGRYGEAVEAYQAAAAGAPEDPLPCLKLARLFGERMGDAEEALRWYREARARGIHPDEERAVMRELVEAAERGGNGLASAPDLARYAEERAGTDEEAWARRVLTELKRELRTGAPDGDRGSAGGRRGMDPGGRTPAGPGEDETGEGAAEGPGKPPSGPSSPGDALGF